MTFYHFPLTSLKQDTIETLSTHFSSSSSSDVEREEIRFYGHKPSDRLRALLQAREICNTLGKPLGNNPNQFTLEFKSNSTCKRVLKIIEESLDLLNKPRKAFIGFQGVIGDDIVLEFTYRVLFSYLKGKCPAIIDIQVVGSTLKKKFAHPECRLALLEAAFSKSPEIGEINQMITLKAKEPRDLDFRVIIQKEFPPSEIIYLIYDFLTTKISETDRERLKKEEILTDSAIRLYGLLLKKICPLHQHFAAVGFKTDSLSCDITVLKQEKRGEEVRNIHYGSQDSLKESLFTLIDCDPLHPFSLKIDTSPFSIKEALLDTFLETTTIFHYNVENWSHHLLGNHRSFVPNTSSNLVCKVIDSLDGSWEDFQKSLMRLSTVRGQEVPSSLYHKEEYKKPLKFLSLLSKDMKKLESDEARLFFLFRACLSLHSGIKSEETFYQNVWTVALKELHLVSYAKEGHPSMANTLVKAIMDEKISFSLLSSFVAFLILSKDPSSLSNDSGTIVIHEQKQLPTLIQLDLGSQIDHLIENFRNSPLNNSLNSLQTLFEGKAFDPRLPYPLLDYLKSQDFYQECVDKFKTLCEEAYPLPIRSLALNALLHTKVNPPLSCLKELPALLSTFSEREQETLITLWMTFSDEETTLLLNDWREFETKWPLPLVKSSDSTLSSFGLDLMIQKKDLDHPLALEAFDFFLLKKPVQSLRLLEEVGSFKQAYEMSLKKLLSAYLLNYEKNPQTLSFAEAKKLTALLRDFFSNQLANREKGPSEDNLKPMIALLWRTPINEELADQLLPFLSSTRKRELCQLYPTKFEKRFLRELYLKEAVASFQENNEKEAVELVRSLLKEIKSGERCSKEEEAFLLTIFEFSTDPELFREEDLPLFFFADHYSEPFLQKLSSFLFLKQALTFTGLSTRSFITFVNSLFDRFSLREAHQWAFIWQRIEERNEVTHELQKEMTTLYQHWFLLQGTPLQALNEANEGPKIIHLLCLSQSLTLNSLLENPPLIDLLLARSEGSKTPLLELKDLFFRAIEELSPNNFDSKLFQKLLESKKNLCKSLSERKIKETLLFEWEYAIEKKFFDTLKNSKTFSTIQSLLTHFLDLYKGKKEQKSFFTEEIFTHLANRYFQLIPKEGGAALQKKINHLVSISETFIASYTLEKALLLLSSIFKCKAHLNCDSLIIPLLVRILSMDLKKAEQKKIEECINEEGKKIIHQTCYSLLITNENYLEDLKKNLESNFIFSILTKPISRYLLNVEQRTKLAPVVLAFFFTSFLTTFKSKLDELIKKSVDSLFNRLRGDSEGRLESINREDVIQLVNVYFKRLIKIIPEEMREKEENASEAFEKTVQKLYEIQLKRLEGNHAKGLFKQKRFENLLTYLLIGKEKEYLEKNDSISDFIAEEGMTRGLHQETGALLKQLSIVFPKTTLPPFEETFFKHLVGEASSSNVEKAHSSFEELSLLQKAFLKDLSEDIEKLERAFYLLVPVIGMNYNYLRRIVQKFSTLLTTLIVNDKVYDRELYMAKMKKAFDQKEILFSSLEKDYPLSCGHYQKALFEGALFADGSEKLLFLFMEEYCNEKVDSFLVGSRFRQTESGKEERVCLSPQEKERCFSDVNEILSYFSQFNDLELIEKGRHFIVALFNKNFFNDSEVPKGKKRAKKKKSTALNPPSNTNRRESLHKLEALLSFHADGKNGKIEAGIALQMENFEKIFTWQLPSHYNFCNAFRILVSILDFRVYTQLRGRSIPQKIEALISMEALNLKLRQMIFKFADPFFPSVGIMDILNTWKEINHVRITELIDNSGLEMVTAQVRATHLEISSALFEVATQCMKMSPEEVDLNRYALFVIYSFRFLTSAVGYTTEKQYLSGLEQLPEYAKLEKFFPLIFDLLLKHKRNKKNVDFHVDPSKLYTLLFEHIEKLYLRSELLFHYSKKPFDFEKCKSRCHKLLDSWLTLLRTFQEEEKFNIDLMADTLISLLRFHSNKKNKMMTSSQVSEKRENFLRFCENGEVMSIKLSLDLEENKELCSLFNRNLQFIEDENHVAVQLAIEFMRLTFLAKRDETFFETLATLIEKLHLISFQEDQLTILLPPVIFSELFFIDEDFLKAEAYLEKRCSIFYKFLTIYINFYLKRLKKNCKESEYEIPQKKIVHLPFKTAPSDENLIQLLEGNGAKILFVRSEEEKTMKIFKSDWLELMEHYQCRDDFRLFLGEALRLNLFREEREEDLNLFEVMAKLAGLKEHLTWNYLKALSFEEVDKELDFSSLKSDLRFNAKSV